MLHVYDYLTRRIHIRSWKDLAAVVIGGLVYFLLSFGLPKLFPNISEKTAEIIGGIAAFITMFALLFALNA